MRGNTVSGGSIVSMVAPAPAAAPVAADDASSLLWVVGALAIVASNADARAYIADACRVVLAWAKTLPWFVSVPLAVFLCFFLWGLLRRSLWSLCVVAVRALCAGARSLRAHAGEEAASALVSTLKVILVGGFIFACLYYMVDGVGRDLTQVRHRIVEAVMEFDLKRLRDAVSRLLQ